jgi:NADPH-dependent curcumin reductase CurA
MASENTNVKVLLKQYPRGAAKESDFEVVSEGFDVPSAAATLKEGDLLLQVTYLSVDPYMRGRYSVRKMSVLHIHTAICSLE